jgi:hypothetical protein
LLCWIKEINKWRFISLLIALSDCFHCDPVNSLVCWHNCCNRDK